MPQAFTENPQRVDTGSINAQGPERASRAPEAAEIVLAAKSAGDSVTMSDYSIDQFRHDLRDALLPHIIYLDEIYGTPQDMTIRTSRINGSRKQMQFTIHVEVLTPELGETMIERILDWYDEHR